MFSEVVHKFLCSKQMLGLPERILPRAYSCFYSIKTKYQPMIFNKECCSDRIQNTVQSRSMVSKNNSGNSVLNKQGGQNSIQHGIEDNVCQSTLSTSPLINYTSVRTIRVYYRPSALKRMRKHGLEKRLSQQSQREVLFRRILRGRNTLTTFDRFMNDLPDYLLKPKGKRVNLFDKKRGYKSIMKKKDYFIFKET